MRDGPTDEGEQLARLCGDASDGQPIFASGSSMRLEFVSAMVSEDDDDNIGFKATLSKGNECKRHLACLSHVFSQRLSAGNQIKLEKPGGRANLFRKLNELFP